MITMREAEFERFNAIECYAMNEEHTFDECVEYAANLVCYSPQQICRE
jgi:hypothetical protein